MNGETMDKSETPIYLTHVVDMCRAYARFGSETADTSRLAAERKICIKMLWQKIPSTMMMHCAHDIFIMNGSTFPKRVAEAQRGVGRCRRNHVGLGIHANRSN